MNIPDTYYGIPASQWQDYPWKITFKGNITLTGRLRSIQETPAGHLAFAIADSDEERGTTMVIVSDYRDFQPVFPEPAEEEDDDEESEEDVLRRIIQHDAMAMGRSFMGRSGGTIRYSYGDEA